MNGGRCEKGRTRRSNLLMFDKGKRGMEGMKEIGRDSRENKEGRK